MIYASTNTRTSALEPEQVTCPIACSRSIVISWDWVAVITEGGGDGIVASEASVLHELDLVAEGEEGLIIIPIRGRSAV